MDFGTNKTPVEIIKEGAFKRTNFFVNIKNELLLVQQIRIVKKAKEKSDNKGGKERAAKYYKDNKDALKEKARNKYKNLTEEEKELKRQYSKGRYNKLKENYYASKNNSFSQYKD